MILDGVILSEALSETLSEMIPGIARQLGKKYRPVAAEDVEQEMWLDAFAHASEYEKLSGLGARVAIGGKLRRAGAGVCREDARYRRAVKAAREGYACHDEAFYSSRMLAKLLPALVQADFDPSVAMETASGSTDAAGVHIRASDPFGGAENYMVTLIDVCTAFQALRKGDQHILRTYYGVPQEETEEGRWERQKLASSMGLTYEVLRKRVNRALVGLAAELGGTDPWLGTGP